MHFILYEEWNQLFNNEELISLLILAVTALYGLPRQADMIFSISGTLSYFMILFMGYRYGASTGAIAGAAGGILLALTGGKYGGCRHMLSARCVRGDAA